MRVAILGCGPAGLVAAHAVHNELDADVHIFSKKRKSELFGAQYLHKPIPHTYPGPSRIVRYELRGEVDAYRRKVYGSSYDGTVSPEGGFDGHEAWDIRLMYVQLWALYGPWVFPADINNEWLLREARKFDAVISTIPAPALCWNHHDFRSQPIWAYGDAPERGQQISGDIVSEGTVICNGEKLPTWYRASRIFGYATLEYGETEQPTTLKAARVEKPISTNCTCWPGITRLGRYGQWKKGVLVHQVYEEALKCLASL